MRFVLIDETVVSHGYWVKISGGQLEQFRKNPIMYWMHVRPDKYGDKNQILPIGKWKDILVENINGIASITAEPVFDEKDEFAMKIKSKVDGDFIKMASAGLVPLTWSELPEDLKPGQTRSTITEWEMLEASIVDIGANRNAFRLMNHDGTINLSFGENSLHRSLDHNIKTQKMKVIALKLGLGETANEAEILNRIEKLQKEAGEAEKLRVERVSKLLKNEKVTDENREHLRRLAEADFELAEKTLEIISQKEPAKTDKTERISDFIEQKRTPQAQSKKWADHNDEELVQLREKNLDAYIKLYEGEFGVKPVIN